MSELDTVIVELEKLRDELHFVGHAAASIKPEYALALGNSIERQVRCLRSIAKKSENEPDLSIDTAHGVCNN